MTAPSNSPGVAISCPVCSASKVEHWAVKNGYVILKCGLCGHGFVSPSPAPEVLADLYSRQAHGGRYGSGTVSHIVDMERRFPNSTIDARRMVARISGMLDPVNSRKKTVRMLDVGCGYGFTSRLAAMAGFDVIALEPARFERRVAKAVSGIEPLPVAFESYQGDRAFDIIVMSQVIEHALNVNLWIAKVRHLLNGGGILALAMPNFENIVCVLFRERDPYVQPPQHLNYFTPRSVRALLRQHGFHVVMLEGISRLGPTTVLRRLPVMPKSRASIGAIRLLHDLPFKVCGWLGFPIMLNVYARKLDGSEKNSIG